MQKLFFIPILLLIAAISACNKEKLSEEDLEQQMLQQVNTLRRSGCRCGTEWMPPVNQLTWNQPLQTAAQAHASDMHSRNYFDHISPEGTSPVQRAQAAGYTGQYVGEDIGKGYATVLQVVNAWKNSESHCRAMMDTLYKEMGAARSGEYWVLELGRPN